MLQWWCGGRATAVIQAVEEVAVQGRPALERPSVAGQAAQLAAARLELALRQAEV